MPMGAIKLKEFIEGEEHDMRAPRRATGKVKETFTIGFVCALVAVAIFNSYVVVRPLALDRAQPLDKLRNRILVQQGEMWWATHQRVFVEQRHDGAEAGRFLFLDPIDPQRNTSIQYLMVLSIGEKTRNIIEQGSNYTGGYPEIAFELLGRLGGFALILLVSSITALLMYALVRAILLNRIITVFTTFYVLFHFLNFHLGGMLNFLVAWTFTVKVAAMLTAMFLEGSGFQSYLRRIAR